MSENTNESKQSLATWNSWVDGLVIKDYENYRTGPTPEVLQCGHEAMEAVQAIFEKSPDLWNYFQQNGKLRRSTIDCIKRAAVMNLSTVNKECYFATRYKGPDAVMEMTIFGDGYRKLLSTFGDGVVQVYREMIVCEGDEFKPPRYIGVKVADPEWEPKFLSNKCIYVVLPVEFAGGRIDYAIVERNEVKKSVYANAKQKLMFVKNDQLKQDVLSALNACETVDDMLQCEVAKPYINPVYFDYPEEMIRRKMINKAIRKFKLKLTPVASKAYVQSEPEYATAMNEITENENSAPLVIDGDPISEETGEVVHTENE